MTYLKRVSENPSHTSSFGGIPSTWIPWVALFFRLGAFALFQSFVALGFLLAKNENPWQMSLAWWPFTVILTNLLCILFLIKKAQYENTSFFTQFRFHKATMKQDLLAMIGIFVITIFLVMGPNIGLAVLLFQDPQAGLKMMDYPLPLWATIISFIFLPTTQMFAEIPTYFTYISPALQKQNLKPWLAIGLAALFLSFQHLSMPLILDFKTIIYRMSMFLLFAIFLGGVLNRRPRLLPYIVIMHALLDAQLLITSLIFAV